MYSLRMNPTVAERMMCVCVRVCVCEHQEQPLVKLRLKFRRRRTTTFHKFIYQNDVRQRALAALRLYKYLLSISQRGMKINCAWRVRCATDAEMDFSFNHPGLPRNCRYRSRLRPVVIYFLFIRRSLRESREITRAGRTYVSPRLWMLHHLTHFLKSVSGFDCTLRYIICLDYIIISSHIPHRFKMTDIILWFHNLFTILAGIAIFAASAINFEKEEEEDGVWCPVVGKVHLSISTCIIHCWTANEQALPIRSKSERCRLGIYIVTVLHYHFGIKYALSMATV